MNFAPKEYVVDEGWGIEGSDLKAKWNGGKQLKGRAKHIRFTDLLQVVRRKQLQGEGKLNWIPSSAFLSGFWK